MPALCLSLHADYLCRHSGPCCTSGWPIHVENDRLDEWRDALDSRRLSFTADSARDGLPFVTASGLPPGAGAILRTRASGTCIFYGEDDGLCAVHRDLGHSSLPSACQHFPRRCLIEPKRVSVSLTHYCPTVARLAFRTDVVPAVVPAPAPLVGRLTLEGLDARDALPPLLRPGLLADHETYHAWEELAVGMLGLDVTPEQALARISAFTEELRTWKPADGSLRERFDALLAARAGASGVGAVLPDYRSEFQFCQPEKPLRPLDTWREAHGLVLASVPGGVGASAAPDDFDALDAAFVAPAWRRYSRPLRQFLAAHAFGNWCAYNGRGLRTVVRSLEVALEVVRVEAARACAGAGRALDEGLLADAFSAADLLLVHLADPTALAERLSAVEQRCRVT